MILFISNYNLFILICIKSDLSIFLSSYECDVDKAFNLTFYCILAYFRRECLVDFNKGSILTDCLIMVCSIRSDIGKVIRNVSYCIL